MSLETLKESTPKNNETREKSLEGLRKELENLENDIEGPKKIIKKILRRFFKDYKESLEQSGFLSVEELREAIQTKQESKLGKHPDLKTLYENINYISKQKEDVKKNLLALIEIYGIEQTDERIFEPSAEEIEKNPELASPELDSSTSSQTEINTNAIGSNASIEKFSEQTVAESINKKGDKKPLQSAPYESRTTIIKGRQYTMTYCGKTGFENAQQLGMEAERNDAEKVALNYRKLLSKKFPSAEVTTRKNGNIGSDKMIEKVTSPTNKTLQYVLTCGTKNPFEIKDIPPECNTLDIHGKFPNDLKIYGHRISAFKDANGKRRVFDVYNRTFERTRKPIPLEDYLKRGRLTFTTVAMHKSDLTFNVHKETQTSEKREKLAQGIEKREFALPEYGKIETLIPEGRNGEVEIYLPGDRSSIESRNNAKQRETQSGNKSAKDKKARIILEGNAQYIRTNGKNRYDALVKSGGFKAFTEQLKNKIGDIKKITLIGHSRGGIAINQILADETSHGLIDGIVSLDGTYMLPSENMKSFLKQTNKKAEVIYIPGGATESGALALSGILGVKLNPSRRTHEQIATDYIAS